MSETPGTNIQELEDVLSSTKEAIQILAPEAVVPVNPPALTQENLDIWSAQHVALKTQLSKSSPLRFVLMGVAALILGGLALLKLLGKTGKTARLEPQKRGQGRNLRRPEPAGVIFLNSPLLAGNVATPLSAAGQLTASNLQMLTGQYAVLRSAYQATGRIGFEQIGVPSSEDYSFGTGFLITDRHIVTNRHVFGLYGQYLTGEGEIGGIEFIAEKEKDASAVSYTHLTLPTIYAV